MRLLGTGMLAVVLGVGFGASPGQAHHSDWGLPLVGGLVGGAGLTALYYNHQRSEAQQRAQPVYAAPPPPAPAPAAPAVPSATTIEDKLNVLDQLAAKGYITPDQYKARRQALLDQLAASGHAGTGMIDCRRSRGGFVFCALTRRPTHA